MFTSVRVYVDDVVLISNRPLPGLRFRVQQAITSFNQQLEQHCCLSKPSDPHRRYPYEIHFLRNAKPRHPRVDYFFNATHNVPQAWAHYVGAFIEEYQALGPDRFIPNQFLPLIVPTAADIEEASAANREE